jgi:tetratricopeptide (TPR) repeat protein
MLWGQALARQGKRTDGLQLYTKGMQLAYPGAATKELSRLVEENPAFQQTERPGTPNSFLAERSFGKGLHAFWSGQYAAAEDEFGKAVAQYDQDARYQYYLGLSRLLQDTKAKRQQARHNFETGARLEAENRPGPRVVNASLERLQGQLRYFLDEYRQKGTP